MDSSLTFLEDSKEIFPLFQQVIRRLRLEPEALLAEILIRSASASGSKRLGFVVVQRGTISKSLRQKTDQIGG